MSTPTDAEVVALDEAGPLLRYAAEHANELDPDLSLAIAEAMQAKQDQQWTPAVSERFWTAFSRLCNLIKPITMECLLAADQSVTSRSWIRFWRNGKKYSLTERTSSRYLILLFCLLFVVTPFQLYVWVSTNMSKQLDDLVAAMTVQSGQLTVAAEPLMSTAKSDTDTFQKAAVKVMEDSKSLSGVAERSFYYIETLSLMSWTHRDTAGVPVPHPPTSEFWTDWYPYATTLVTAAKTQTLRAEGNANLIAGIIVSFLLPILFGAIGAVAYVIRAISDQIRNTTFSKSSPIRHVMRVMLGALMGAVIGLFSTLSVQVSLPPLALAFLSGYGVEAVFSMFDSFVDRFRQSPAPAAR
jgi:hypothetical protein